MGFLSVLNLVNSFSELALGLSLINFAESQCTSTCQGGDNRKKRWGEGQGEGRLFKGGDYFKYFHQRGAIIRGRRLIEGRLLLEEIRYVKNLDITKLRNIS